MGSGQWCGSIPATPRKISISIRSGADAAAPEGTGGTLRRNDCPPGGQHRPPRGLQRGVRYAAEARRAGCPRQGNRFQAGRLRRANRVAGSLLRESGFISMRSNSIARKSQEDANETHTRSRDRARIPVSIADWKTVPALYPESPKFQRMPQVIATGFLVGLLERACIHAINPHLDWPEEQAVGTHIEVRLSASSATSPHTLTRDSENRIPQRVGPSSLSAACVDLDQRDPRREGIHMQRGLAA